MFTNVTSQKGGDIVAGFDRNNRDPEVEALIDQYPEEKDIYRFMRNEYETLENTYDSETLDKKVLLKASEEFPVSSVDAGDLYTRMEVRIADFWQDRFEKEGK